MDTRSIGHPDKGCAQFMHTNQQTFCFFYESQPTQLLSSLTNESISMTVADSLQHNIRHIILLSLSLLTQNMHIDSESSKFNQWDPNYISTSLQNVKLNINLGFSGISGIFLSLRKHLDPSIH